MEVSGQYDAPVALPPERAPGTHSTGGWVGVRAGLDDLESSILPLPGIEPQIVQPVA